MLYGSLMKIPQLQVSVVPLSAQLLHKSWNMSALGTNEQARPIVYELSVSNE